MLPPAPLAATVADVAQQHTSVTGILFGAAAVVGAITALWKFLHIGELLRGTRSFLQDWNGEAERPGTPARPGFPERMATVEKRTEDINHLFRGEVTSRLILLGEGVEQLQTRGAENATALSRLEGRVDGVDRRITDHRRRNEEQIEHLRLEVERRLSASQAAAAVDHLRTETYRAALQEMGFDVQPPQPHAPDNPPDNPSDQ